MRSPDGRRSGGRQPRFRLLAIAAALLLGLGLGGALIWGLQPPPARQETARSPAPPTEAPVPEPAAPEQTTAALPVEEPPTVVAVAPLPVEPSPAVPPPAATPAPSPAPPQVARPSAPPVASEAEIVALLPAEPVMLRLRENPRVFVLLFPSLAEQGAALNRLAALVEKAGLPRDRLLRDEELGRAIQQSGDTPATWYLGHDYNGTDVARFLALAERDGIPLNQGERWVRDRFLEARALVPPEAEIALISTANPEARMDPMMRAAILRHEIGHGHFFTLPEFRAHVLRVWRERFREHDRQAFRSFLAREGYDATNEVLMANEAMAYLIFTPDPRFFSARLIGMTEPEVARLRTLMRDGAPLP